MRTPLPPTLNLHIIGACDYACRFCYRDPRLHSRERRFSLAQGAEILREFKRLGGTRVRFAGGEPTLHPELRDLLKLACAAGLVPSLVTHGRHIDAAWIGRHLPWLRWLTLSVDTDSEATSDLLGRRLRRTQGGHVAHIEEVCARVRAWNSLRPAERRVHVVLNMTVTALNVHETPVDYLRRCRPARVKLLQMLPVEGENDAATGLACPDTAFREYVARVQPLQAEGIRIVPESNDDMDGSYAMMDSLGRFFQRRDSRYAYSRPVLDVGMEAAFAEVGGYRRERFIARGADYDPGAVPDGNLPYLIAIEGLDGTGKTTVARLLAIELGVALVRNPPDVLAQERALADARPEQERRAWYAEANRIAAEDAVRHQWEGRAVVMDRCAASTVAFKAASSGMVARPEDWPSGVTRPDLTILLNVPEPVRLARLAARPSKESQEEARLRCDDGFRARVLAGYEALGALRLPAGGPPEEVVASIRNLMEQGAQDDRAEKRYLPAA